MIKLALIGCGRSADYHKKRFDLNAHRMKFVAACDNDLENAKKVADACGGEYAVADYKEILDKVDAVIIETPHFTHHEIAVNCLNAGKDVLIEKPMAITEEQCLDVIDAWEKSGKIFMIGYTLRFYPVLDVFRKLAIDEKIYGDLFHLSMYTEQHTFMGNDHWHHKVSGIGGGQLIAQGYLYMDMMLLCLGNPVEGAQMGINKGTEWMEKEGTTDVFVRFENGSVGYYFGTWGARGTKHGYEFHAHCQEGTFVANIITGELFGYKNDNENKAELLYKADESDDPVHREFTYFLDCIDQPEKPYLNAYDSLQGLRVIRKLYEANEDKKFADLRGLGLGKPIK